MASGLEVSASSTSLETSGVREGETEAGQGKPGKRGNPSGRRVAVTAATTEHPPQQLTLDLMVQVDPKFTGTDCPPAGSQIHRDWLSPSRIPNSAPQFSTPWLSAPGPGWAGRALPAEGPWVTLNCGTTSDPVGNLHLTPSIHSSLLCGFHSGALPFMTLLPVMFYCLHVLFATRWLLQALWFILYMSVLLAFEEHFFSHSLAFWWSVQKITFASNHSPLVCLGGGWGSSISISLWILKPWYCTQKGQPQLPTKLSFQLD